MERGSFIVTGPSASGKTTLIRHAFREGFNILPSHTTRSLRQGEQNGVDMVAVSSHDFINNFFNGEYLEPSLNFALWESANVYYGTPKTWLDSLRKSGRCAMPTSLTVARNIVEHVDAQWIHLTCPDAVRFERLRRRGISDEEIVARMESGESINIPDEADTIVDTSEFAVFSIMEIIQKERVV